VYDKEVKSYVYELEGTSARMQLPQTDRQALGLSQPFLAIQLKIPAQKGFAMEVALLDATRKRRRILWNAGNKETVSTALHARVPLGPIIRGRWLNLCFDIRDMTSRLWPGAEFQSMELVSVASSCKVRRIATLRGAPADTTEVRCCCCCCCCCCCSVCVLVFCVPSTRSF
jgi:hypothetical protein